MATLALSGIEAYLDTALPSESPDPLDELAPSHERCTQVYDARDSRPIGLTPDAPNWTSFVPALVVFSARDSALAARLLSPSEALESGPDYYVCNEEGLLAAAEHARKLASVPRYAYCSTKTP